MKNFPKNTKFYITKRIFYIVSVKIRYIQLFLRRGGLKTFVTISLKMLIKSFLIKLKILELQFLKSFCSAQKMKFSVKDFLNKCDQIRSLL